jgi:hypothetical protein
MFSQQIPATPIKDPSGSASRNPKKTLPLPKSTGAPDFAQRSGYNAVEKSV